jgi:spore maturation protein CgeB
VSLGKFRIAFFGSSLVSSYWNGAATYYRGLLKALSRKNCEITFYEPDAYDRQLHRDIPDPDWARVAVYPSNDASAAYRALERAAGADLIVKASGVGVFDSLLEREALALRAPGTMVAFWDVDAPATLARVAGDSADEFRALVPRYDLIFTYGGGDAVVNGYAALGARVCVPIYNALDPSTHFPVAPVRRFRGDLGFLGNRLPDRETRVEEFFLNPAARAPNKAFTLGGNGWDGKMAPPNVRYINHVYSYEHNAFNCSHRAVLNVNRMSMAVNGFSPPTRVFEAAGAAACLITDLWNGIEMFLDPGEEVLTASGGAEVSELLCAIEEKDARRIGQAARRRVLAQHTYSHRALEVERALSIRSLSAASVRVEAGR